jgi:hypothetical protein
VHDFVCVRKERVKGRKEIAEVVEVTTCDDDGDAAIEQGVDRCDDLGREEVDFINRDE